MVNPLKRFLAWRKEQRTKERVIIGAYDSGRELTKVLAGLAFIGLTDEQKQKLIGTKLRCIFCKREFVHQASCTLGFCPRCSK